MMMELVQQPVTTPPKQGDSLQESIIIDKDQSMQVDEIKEEEKQEQVIPIKNIRQTFKNFSIFSSEKKEFKDTQDALKQEV